LARALMRPSPPATASAMACVCLRCFLFSNRASPAVALYRKRIPSSAATTSLQPGALSTTRLRSPAWRSVPHVYPRGCAPFPLAQTHPPALKATCLRVHPFAPARLSLSLAYNLETQRTLGADASFDWLSVSVCRTFRRAQQSVHRAPVGRFFETTDERTKPL
jgi:hypothetical protein